MSRRFIPRPAPLRVLLAILLLGCGHAAHYAPSPPLALTSDRGRLEPPPKTIATADDTPAALESFVLPNGMRVVVVERPELPIALVRYVALDAGNDRVTPAQVGLPELTARVLVSGGTKTAKGEFRDIELFGMHIEQQASDSFTALQFRVGAEVVQSAIAILARAVRYPTFAEIDPSKGELLRELAQRTNRVAPTADRLLQELLFGPDDARAVQDDAWRDRVRGHGVTAVRGWYARYTPERSALVVVGRVDPDKVRDAALQSFADWQVERHAAPASALHSLGSGRYGVHVLTGNAPASMIALGYPTVSITHADYLSTELITRALGRTPTAAAWLSLRHRTGVSYIVSAYQRATSRDGQLVVSTFVQQDSIERGLELLLDTTARFAERGLTADELEQAKHDMLRDFELRAETCGRIADLVSWLFQFGDPAAALGRLRSQLNTLTLAQVNEAARRYLNPHAQILLVAGPYVPGDSHLRRLEKPQFYRVEMH